ncbi:hypothetical protein ACI2L1_14445 [Streptomyces sp. NPDC019531]
MTLACRPRLQAAMAEVAGYGRRQIKDLAKPYSGPDLTRAPHPP